MSLSQGSAFIVFSKSGDLMYPLEASWFPVFISIWLLSLGTSLTLSPSQVSWLSRICLQFLLILDSFPPHLGYSKLLSFKTNVKSHFLKKYFPIPQSEMTIFRFPNQRWQSIFYMPIAHFLIRMQHWFHSHLCEFYICFSKLIISSYRGNTDLMYFSIPCVT